MRHLVAILLICILVFPTSCKYFKSSGLFGKKARTMAILKAQEDSIRVADSIQKVQDRLLAKEIARLDSVRNDEKLSSMEAKRKYNIIVGSFLTPEYAQGLMEMYREQGYNPEIIKMTGSRFELVAIEAYDNFTEAFSQLKKFQDTVQFESWLYIKQ